MPLTYIYGIVYTHQEILMQQRLIIILDVYELTETQIAKIRKEIQETIW